MSSWIYLLVFAAVAVDGFLPVVPSEALVIGLSASGRPHLVALAAAVTAGGIAGDRVTYLFGRLVPGHGGRRLVAARARAERALRRFGGGAILAGRFLPYGRMATSLMSGATSLPLGRFWLFSGVASAAWAAYVIGLGRLGGETFAHSPLLGAASGILLGLVLAGVHRLAARRRAATPAEARELTTAGRS